MCIRALKVENWLFSLTIDMTYPNDPTSWIYGSAATTAAPAATAYNPRGHSSHNREPQLTATETPAAQQRAPAEATATTAESPSSHSSFCSRGLPTDSVAILLVSKLLSFWTVHYLPLDTFVPILYMDIYTYTYMYGWTMYGYSMDIHTGHWNCSILWIHSNPINWYCAKTSVFLFLIQHAPDTCH